MNNEYDFFDMGIRRAKEGLINLKKMAEEIGRQFGENAKLEFESGIASAVPTYSDFQRNDILERELSATSTKFGVSNTRNNSYFGNSGISNQYNNSDGRYNEPSRRK